MAGCNDSSSGGRGESTVHVMASFQQQGVLGNPTSVGAPTLSSYEMMTPPVFRCKTRMVSGLHFFVHAVTIPLGFRLVLAGAMETKATILDCGKMYLCHAFMVLPRSIPFSNFTVTTVWTWTIPSASCTASPRTSTKGGFRVCLDNRSAFEPHPSNKR